MSAGLYGDAWHVVSFSVFGLTLLLLYSIYALYHVWHTERGKQIFLRLGRAAAFLLIAGTYTPFMLVSLRGPWGWTLFGIVWALCGTGAVLQLIVGNRYRVTSTLATLFFGWMIVVAIKPLAAVLPHGGLWLLLAGGLCYTVAAAISPAQAPCATATHAAMRSSSGGAPATSWRSSCSCSRSTPENGGWAR